MGAGVQAQTLAEHRNLGKAFYENPTTQKQAVREFRLALLMAPGSVREQLNYGLALLRAGDTAAGMIQLKRAQARDPKLPYTWFNLGIEYQKQGDYDAALAQFRQMERLVPNEPVTHYHLGALLKLNGDNAAAAREFEIARDLNPNLVAPHFQLYGLYRQLGRSAEADVELAIFQSLKQEQGGAAIPENMDWSQYSEIYDPIGDNAPVSLSAPVYRDQVISSGFGTGTSGVIAIALDGGNRASLIAWSAGRVGVFRYGAEEIPDSGLADLRDVVAIAAGDFDNDGLPDLCVITPDAAWLYRNSNGKFHQEAKLATGSFRQAVWLDYDHDYDEDLILLGRDSRLLRNDGSAGFSEESKRFPFVAGEAIDAARFDLEPDTPGFDLVVSYRDRPGILYRDRLGGTYAATPLDALPAGASDLRAYDANPDSRTDLAFHTADGAARLLLNRTSGFEPGSPVTAEDLRAGADLDGKGRLDHAFIAPGGALHLERDVTPNYGNWIEIALTGVKNPKMGPNAKIEVKAGRLYRKITYEGVPVVVRLGPRLIVDTVRVTWPNGLIQNESRQVINRVTRITEAPRLSGSCPMVFTWNGNSFEFITDVLGVAPLGASSGDGKYFPVDHQEYVSIPGSALRPRDGAYEIRFTEELREVSYIDQIKLVALDHPVAVPVITNEKFKGPPFPEFRLFGGERRIDPVAAHDSSGKDVLAAVLSKDNVYPDSFRRDQTGVAEMHTLDLDFGSAAASNRAVLVLDGWVDWADGSTFLAATQEHKDLTFPYVQVKNDAGQWVTVLEDMGIPSGKPKAIAVDLTGKFLSASREVRIVTNLCVYWDQIYLLEDSAPPPNRLTGIPLLTAGLHFRGFSKVTIDPERKQPERFDYQSVRPVSMWNPTPGLYTRYGDVQDLLKTPDDRMVVMGSGDEIAMRFEPRGLPELPAGWTRDFLLLVDGWAKDADANTAFSQSVFPLPFHSMSVYPYPDGERYPEDSIHNRYQVDYNIRPGLLLIRPLEN
jgi:tetratricopeptide (TPR) repeat protein